MTATFNPAIIAGVARAAAVSAFVVAGSAIMCSAAPAQAGPPDIRTSERNRVPACTTPDRLMTFLRARNGSVDSRWRDIAQHYKAHGDTWRVRWDYAFFQMLVETNYLTYRTPGGGMGDVHPRQNNFAGIGATGGVPGDSFPNASTGVLAQIQHLVAYSGERLDNPTAPRTRLKMDEILTKSKALGRPVTFQDLSGRWAVDRAYGRSIEFTAQSFRSAHCSGQPMVSGDGKPARQRMSAHWPRPGHGADTSQAASRGDGGSERAARSNLGRVSGRARENESNDQPAVKPKRPLQRPVVTGSVRKSDPEETAGAPQRTSAQRVLPNAPPPIIKPKPPAEQQVQPAAAAPPVPPAAVAQAAPVATSSAAKLPPPAAPAANALPSVASPAAAAAPAVTGSAGPRAASACKIFRASYGGPKTVLIQAQKEGITNYTLLEVTTGREQDQTKAFMDAHARGGKIVGEFPAEAEALKKSFELCPGG
jgi:hypothetical protein